MRYLVFKKATPKIVIWTKSQFPVEVSFGVTRECTHYDYMKQHGMSMSDISSVGMVYYDVHSKRMEVSVLPWDTPSPKRDKMLVRKEAFAFVKNHPELMTDVQYEWNEFLQLKCLEKSAGRKF